MEAICLKNVTKTYKMDGIKLDAIRNMSISIKEGEFVAIMGASGSGKSTLLHIIGLLDRPTTGSIIIDGINSNNLDDDQLAEFRGQKIGFVFQSFNLYPTMTAMQNIELPLMIQEYNQEERENKARELLKAVGLADRVNHMPSQLSGGQKQRVAIARALVTDPDIVLADEPTGNLDSKSGKELLDMLVKINEDGRTIIVITHDPNIASYAKRIIKIKDGSIVSDNKSKKGDKK